MAEDAPITAYLVGTAGSGKSRLTYAWDRWMSERGLDAITVNLDPGADRLAYGPDVDIRDWITLEGVMDQYGLGPNGAQVVAADLVALQAMEVKEAIESFRTDLVLVDTPGQMELFVFRNSGRFVVDLLSPDRSLLAFLIDPYLARDPTSFVSQLMLSATTQFRFQVPQVNVLTKIDLLKEEGDGEDEGPMAGGPAAEAPEPRGRERTRGGELDVDLDTLLSWAEDLDRLYDELMTAEPTLYTQLNTDIFRALQSMGTYTALTPVSGATLEGVEDLYTYAVNAFRASEDMEAD